MPPQTLPQGTYRDESDDEDEEEVPHGNQDHKPKRKLKAEGSNPEAPSRKKAANVENMETGNDGEDPTNADIMKQLKNMMKTMALKSDLTGIQSSIAKINERQDTTELRIAALEKLWAENGKGSGKEGSNIWEAELG